MNGVQSPIFGAKTANFAAIALAFCLFAALGFLCSRPALKTVQLSSYATDLTGRTPHQRLNARKAASLVNGVVIPPGQVFSFDKTLGGWSSDRGYLRAPVSYDGVLVDEYGGGVCQTSTTIYNAALLAGLPILERHAHTFSPSYAPAGRDAAVAYPHADLRFKNSYPWPLILSVRQESNLLVCRIEGKGVPARVALEAQVLDRFPAPPGIVQPGAGQRRSRWHLEGRDGVRVALYRNYYNASGQILRRELISDNTYQPISRAQWAEN
jgi:hypothetical protein